MRLNQGYYSLKTNAITKTGIEKNIFFKVTMRNFQFLWTLAAPLDKSGSDTSATVKKIFASACQAVSSVIFDTYQKCWATKCKLAFSLKATPTRTCFFFFGWSK